MPERISRPAIRLSPALPDGNNNGSGVVAKHFLGTGDRPDDRYAVVRVGVADHVHSWEGDSDVAILKIRAIEFPDDQRSVQELLEACRGGRVGELQFPAEDSEDWDELQSLRRTLGEWQTEQKLSGPELGERWKHVMGDQDGDGPLDANVPRLREFLLTVGALEDPRRSPDDDAQPAED